MEDAMKNRTKMSRGFFGGGLVLFLILTLSGRIAAQGTWTTKAPMPTARNDLAVAAVGGVLYAVGGKTGNTCTGLHTLEAYDPATDSWTTKAPMPTGRYIAGAAALNGLLYVVGGDDHCAGHSIGAVEAYDPVTDTWTTKASMLTPRVLGAVAVVNGVLYVLGGYNFPQPVSTVEAYDPATNTWTTKAPMLMASYTGIAGVVNGIIYIAAGSSGDVEAYDPATDTWTTKAAMPVSGFVNGAAAGVVNGILYVVGGYNATGAVSSVEAYDPVSDTWTSGSPMLSPRLRFGAGVINGILYAVGGGPDNPVLATNEAFTPSSPVITVTIDIKPGSFPNAIKPRDKGFIPVAILTTNTFDATTVDPLSVKFGPNGATEIHNKGHIEDVDGDGDLDLLLHFATQATGIKQGDVSASLTGKTFGGQVIQGSDAIVTVGGNSKIVDLNPEVLGLETSSSSAIEAVSVRNYPNPFNPSTVIKYELPRDGHVTLKVYNSLGEEVALLVSEFQPAGSHTVSFNAQNLSSGVYFYRLSTGEMTATKKLILLK
jgi:N-acetylneuraminic acid mutarotase